MIQLYCGEGKGKTSAAVGAAIRAAGAGKNVIFSQFMKGRQTSELSILKTIPNIKILRSDIDFGFYVQMSEEQKKELTGIHNGILQKIMQSITGVENDFVVMDEITYPYNYNMIDKEALKDLLEYGHVCEFVLTGRDPAEIFLERADYISRLECERHPYERGVAAREGIEY